MASAPKKVTKTEAPAKTTKITIHFNGDSSRIVRDGLPFIIDQTQKNLEWLVAKGYKAEEIEIIGEKPATWDVMFNMKELTPA